MRYRLFRAMQFLLLVLLVQGLNGQAGGQQIRLLVRADDLGSSHAANVACIQSVKSGIARSIEVMVPTPWFPEAVALLKENSGIDIGVHLTLTSEWDGCKWRPLTAAPSLVDSEGFFFPTNKAFLASSFKLSEVEAELRAQIEMARRLISTVSHLSVHMGTPAMTPELRALTERLAEEYKLPVQFAGLSGFHPGWKGTDNGDQKEEALVARLEKLGPGTWLLVDHPGLDTPELQATGHEGYRHVAADRAGVTQAFTSQRVKELLEKRRIELISYGDLLVRH